MHDSKQLVTGSHSLATHASHGSSVLINNAHLRSGKSWDQVSRGAFPGSGTHNHIRTCPQQSLGGAKMLPSKQKYVPDREMKQQLAREVRMLSETRGKGSFVM